MSNISRIHTDKTPNRLHYIPEWAEKREMRQADISRELDVDKSVVSRWFDGKLPKQESLDRLAELFQTDVEGLFRHPDDDWLSKFFRDKTEEQKERAISMLKLMFEQPPRTGTRD